MTALSDLVLQYSLHVLAAGMKNKKTYLLLQLHDIKRTRTDGFVRLINAIRS